MRILVTGARGFVGAHLARLLEARGDEVTGLDRSEADVADLAAVSALVASSRPEAVVHLAARPHVGRSHGEPVAVFQTNVLGTVSVLEAVRQHAPEARVVLASSADVYGVVPIQELPISEEAAIAPASPYGASKAAAEGVALQYHRAYGLDVVVGRGFNAIGPGQSSSFAVPSFALQLASIARGETAPILRVGNLEAERDFTDVRDVARAYAALVDVGLPARIFNICSGSSVSLRSVVDELVHGSGLDVEVRVDPERLRPIDAPRIVGDSTQIRSATGWQPEIGLAATISDVYAEALAAGSPVQERHG